MSKEKRRQKNFSYNRDGFLDQQQKKKCMEKFSSYKALGSSLLSKNELRRVLLQLGKVVNQQQLLEMIYQADPNGHGYISYEAFERIVQSYKENKEENVCYNIGLTFEEILKAYQLNTENFSHRNITWDYIQKYLEDNFDLKINIKSLKPPNSKTELTKQEFKYLFS